MGLPPPPLPPDPLPNSLTAPETLVGFWTQRERKRFGTAEPEEDGVDEE